MVERFERNARGKQSGLVSGSILERLEKSASAVATRAARDASAGAVELSRGACQDGRAVRKERAPHWQVVREGLRVTAVEHPQGRRAGVSRATREEHPPGRTSAPRGAPRQPGGSSRGTSAERAARSARSAMPVSGEQARRNVRRQCRAVRKEREAGSEEQAREKARRIGRAVRKERPGRCGTAISTARPLRRRSAPQGARSQLGGAVRKERPIGTVCSSARNDRPPRGSSPKEHPPRSHGPRAGWLQAWTCCGASRAV